MTDLTGMNAVVTKTKEELENLGAEEFLNLQFDEIADLEGYAPKPTGMYGFNVLDCEIEEVGAEKKVVIKLVMDLTEVVELSADADPDEVGELPAKYTESFFLSGQKIGGRAFVTMTRQLAQEQNWSGVAEAVSGIVGFSGTGMIIKRSWKDKDTGDVKYGNQIDAKTVTWL